LKETQNTIGQIMLREDENLNYPLPNHCVMRYSKKKNLLSLAKSKEILREGVGRGREELLSEVWPRFEEVREEGSHD